MVKKTTTLTIDEEVLKKAKLVIPNLSAEVEKILILRSQTNDINYISNKLKEIDNNSINKLKIQSFKNKHEWFNTLITIIKKIKSEFMTGNEWFIINYSKYFATILKEFIDEFEKEIKKYSFELYTKLELLTDGLYNKDETKIKEFILDRYNVNKTIYWLSNHINKTKGEQIRKILKEK